MFLKNLTIITFNQVNLKVIFVFKLVLKVQLKDLISGLKKVVLSTFLNAFVKEALLQKLFSILKPGSKNYYLLVCWFSKKVNLKLRQQQPKT